MKKIFFFIAALVVAMTANAAVVNAHPNGGEAGVLSWFLGQANAGDTLILADGEYNQPGSLSFNKEGLVVIAADGAKPVIALNDEGGWTTMKVDASTTFDGITFDGKGVAKYPVYINGTAVKKATFVNCEFKNYVKYAISDPYGGGTHVDSLIVNNCYFHDGGEAVYISKYGLDGQHGCNYCEITNSTLYNLTTSDYAGMIHVSSCNEATGAQNEVVIDHVTLYNYTGSSLGGIAIRKSSNLKISNSIIANPSDKTGFYAFYIYGGTIDNTLYYNTNDDADATHTACLTVDPLFVDAANGNLALAEGSPAIGAATDGSNLGDPRWNKPAAATRTVTIVVLPEGAATVTGAGEYEDGASVTVTASESDDYVFMGWMDYATEEIVAYDYEYTFQVLEDVVLIAYYIPLLEGESKDLVIGENTLTASAELSIGKLNMNLVLGEEEEGLYWLAETSTLSIDGNEAILVDGVAMVVPEAQAAVAEMIVMYNEALYYIGVVMVAPETSVDNITTTVAPTKIFKNGQILVVREGVAYDLVGRIVK